MDYGQTKQTQQPTTQNFFTADANGQGTNPAESINSLNTSGNDWNTTAIEHDPKNVGKGALYEGPMPQQNPNTPSAMGEIVNLEMPPSTPEPQPNPQASDSQPQDQKDESATDFSNIKTTEKSLSPAGIQEISKSISKFNGDGKVADFYDNARKMMEANLENSFGRKLQ